MTQERRNDDAATTYQTVVGPSGVRRIVRTDGQPLGPGRLSAPLPDPTPDPEPAPIVVSPEVHAARVAAFKADVLARLPARTTGPNGGTIPDPAPQAHPWKTQSGVEEPQEASTLRQRREALGISQRRFAALLGLTRGSWAAVESGARPGAAHRRHAAQVLDRLAAGTLQMQANPMAEVVRRQVAALRLEAARTGVAFPPPPPEPPAE